METITIKLAGTDYTVRPLTLRQARAIGLGVRKEQEAIDQAVSVISVALSRDNPELTPDHILDMEVGPREVIKACEAILTFSGLVPKEDATGEAVPGAAA